MTTVRLEEPADVAQIRIVNESAFDQPNEADLVDKLRQRCENLVSLVAVANDKVVGHILFSPLTIGGRDQSIEGMALGPMAVLPAFQRQGIGSELIHKGLQLLRDRGCPFVVVLGHPEYYPRFGFVPASRHNIRCEWDVPDEVFMILPLGTHALRDVEGTAVYQTEFYDLA